jgi:biotin transporter BioY
LERQRITDSAAGFCQTYPVTNAAMGKCAQRFSSVNTAFRAVRLCGWGDVPIFVFFAPKGSS